MHTQVMDRFFSGGMLMDVSLLSASKLKAKTAEKKSIAKRVDLVRVCLCDCFFMLNVL